MKYLLIISLTISVAALTALLLSLFDIITLSPLAHNVLGVVALVFFAYFIRNYIKLYKSTRRH